LGQKYEPDLQTASLPGWRRTWDVRQPNRAYYVESAQGRVYPENILYLNVTAQPGSVLNGVVIVVTVEQLAAFDQREWMYDRIAVTGNLSDIRIAGGDVFLYAAKPEFVVRDVKSPQIAAVRATYLEIVETGLSALGPSFREDYERSTDPVPAHLIIQDILDQTKTNAPASQSGKR
jgi:hypothetical protein